MSDHVTAEVVERFWSKVTKNGPEDCWIFRGCEREGYGKFGVDARVVDAHRFSYQITHGPIPKGHHIHHTCKTRNCVNPDHLRALTPKEHSRLHNHKGIPDHCPKGHEMNEANTLIVVRRENGSECWFCRTCNRERQRSISAETRAHRNARRRELKRIRKEANQNEKGQ